ncbi:hypothetical protein F7R97_15200 [Acinetobacter baumannii]|nr:hypothetical protein F7R97_15200 [Acinetobacter baumannii]TPT13264.1 hypothetical protein FJU73_11665 [Acinetobacter baumannii]
MELKKIYFYLLKRYKKKIVFLILFFTLVSVFIQVKVGLIDYGYFFVIFLSCYVSIYTWCNGIFAETLPITELSNNGEVIARWMMIFLSTFFHIYILVNPLLNKWFYN